MQLCFSRNILVRFGRLQTFFEHYIDTKEPDVFDIEPCKTQKPQVTIYISHILFKTSNK